MAKDRGHAGMGMTMPMTKHGSATAILAKAVALHEEHMKDPKTATPQSQQRLMVLLKRALAVSKAQ